MRGRLLELFRAGVARAEPGVAVAAALDDLDRPDLVLALGKAAVGMVGPVLERHPGIRAIVVTNPENAVPVPGATVIAGGHPVPDGGSARAGVALLDAAERLGEGERCLVLVSGGGSALAVAPVDGVTVADKADLSRHLLAAGLDIAAMNRVRQSVSRLKGGGLARAAAPARVTSLILSDVVGDDPATIASGPTVAPNGTLADARAILRRAGLWDDVPPGVRAALSAPEPPPPARGDWRLVGSNALSVAAMARAAPEAVAHPDPLTGDVAEAAARIAAAARRGPGLHLWGGETTVVVTGRGTGGRNQELALRVAMRLEDLDRPWTFLSGGTDGRDGPTDAAGGLVDHGTVARARAAGMDVAARLAENDSHPVLDAAGDLLRIGATGTNVADLQILWVG
ncbi:glycerate kinase [Jannaschia sp. LMIT008]|uniref:glycerate kinase type-2 family protein n=1 Tax=Jannaschia maritima TaxID=3032585 RepID=UPI0028111395|nr:DUF4147 domain-containing protein [Jannaschia sp. LMIT008]